MSEDFEARLKEVFSESQVALGSNGRYWVSLNSKDLVQAVERLNDKLSMRQLAVIIGEDMRDSFLCNYVFTEGSKVVILQARIEDHENPSIPSLACMIPGAIVYERELKDLFGITPVGHPDIRRQAVPEDWPADVYPLRKDTKFDSNGEVIRQEAK
jgi:Ni,Fe-hydrogenase III component G